jgi:hypothetical protein
LIQQQSFVPQIDEEPEELAVAAKQAPRTPPRAAFDATLATIEQPQIPLPIPSYRQAKRLLGATHQCT